MKHTIFILITMATFACTQKFYIAPKLAECSIGGKSECYLIKNQEEGNWIMIAEDIVGFDFEEGYVYRVVVRKIKLVDDFGTERPAYEIVDVIEKKPYTGRTKTDDESSTFYKTEYSLTKLVVEGNEINIPRQINMVLDLSAKAISGYSGCNNFFGTIEMGENSSVRIGPLGMTRKLCADSTASNFENMYVRKIEETNEIIFTEDGVTFLTPSRDQLEFYTN